MEKREQKISRSWKVISLGLQAHGRGECSIPISSNKFRDILKFLNEKGYKRVRNINGETQYRCDSVRISLFINKLTKTVRAEALSESGLSKVIADFDLPAYRQDL